MLGGIRPSELRPCWSFPAENRGEWQLEARIVTAHRLVTSYKVYTSVLVTKIVSLVCQGAGGPRELVSLEP